MATSRWDTSYEWKAVTLLGLGFGLVWVAISGVALGVFVSPISPTPPPALWPVVPIQP